MNEELRKIIEMEREKQRKNGITNDVKYLVDYDVTSITKPSDSNTCYETCEICGNDATHQRTRLVDGKLVMKCVCTRCLLRKSSAQRMPRPKCRGCGKFISRDYLMFNGEDGITYLACSDECVVKALGYTQLKPLKQEEEN